MAKDKKFRELSDEELKQVTGGGNWPGYLTGTGGLTVNGGATESIYIRDCYLVINPCEPGMWQNPMKNCQCVPVPNP